MLHQSHASITGPALLVVVTHNVLIVRVWVLCEIPLYQVPGFISRKPRGPMGEGFHILILKINYARRSWSLLLVILSHLKKMWMRSM